MGGDYIQHMNMFITTGIERNHTCRMQRYIAVLEWLIVCLLDGWRFHALHHPPRPKVELWFHQGHCCSWVLFPVSLLINKNCVQLFDQSRRYQKKKERDNLQVKTESSRRIRNLGILKPTFSMNFLEKIRLDYMSMTDNLA